MPDSDEPTPSQAVQELPRETVAKPTEDPAKRVARFRDVWANPHRTPPRHVLRDLERRNPNS